MAVLGVPTTLSVIGGIAMVTGLGNRFVEPCISDL
jgi:hypothetical protein